MIIDHFDKYPLLTQKRANYLLFKRAFELYNVVVVCVYFDLYNVVGVCVYFVTQYPR